MNVFIACPTHDGRIHYKTAEALYDRASEKHQLFISVGQTSLLNWNCNQMLCNALTMRSKHNFRWFAMLHSDVVPEPYWLDKLIAIAEEKNADMLSACIAIKDEGGDVSTGISNPANNHWNYLRLNGNILSTLPATFSIKNLQVHPESKLLVNTGCCIIRLDKDWSDKLIFQGSDRIIVNAQGEYQALVDPEDWNISRQVNDNGGVVMATTKVRCDHIGTKAYGQPFANKFVGKHE